MSTVAKPERSRLCRPRQAAPRRLCRGEKPAAVHVAPSARRPLYAVLLRHPGGLVEMIDVGLTAEEADATAARLSQVNPELRVEKRPLQWAVEVFPGRFVKGGA